MHQTFLRIVAGKQLGGWDTNQLTGYVVA